MSSKQPEKLLPTELDCPNKPHDNDTKRETYAAINKADFEAVRIAYEYDFRVERARKRRLQEIVSARDAVWAEVPKDKIKAVATAKLAEETTELEKLKAEMEVELRQRNELHDGQDLLMKEVRREFWRRRNTSMKPQPTIPDDELFGKLSKNEEDWIANGFPRYLTSEEIAVVEAQKLAEGKAKNERQTSHQRESKLRRGCGGGQRAFEIKENINIVGVDNDSIETDHNEDMRLATGYLTSVVGPGRERRDSAMFFGVGEPSIVIVSHEDSKESVKDVVNSSMQGRAI